jgi:uncharacterized protein
MENRVLVDTNLWISFLIGPAVPYLESLLYSHDVKLLISRELLDEIEEVATRRKFARYFDLADVYDLIEILTEECEEVFVNSSVDLCRDPKDNFLLAIARDGKANVLLTGDNDLLTLGSFEGTQILTITEYFDLQRP